MITKTDLDLAATRVRIEGGTLLDVSDAARDRGTTIAVRDLFQYSGTQEISSFRSYRKLSHYGHRNTLRFGKSGN